MSSPFLPLLALYLVAMAALGLRARRRSATPDGFFVADRSLGSFLSAAALSGTVVSATATLVAADVVYRVGLPGASLDLVGGLALVLLGLFLAGRVRRTGLTTLPEIAGAAFGPAVRRIAAVVALVAQVSFMALLSRGVATVVGPSLGIDPRLACVLATAATAFSTIAGGQVAVALTDVVQLALMAVAVFAILVPFSLAAAGDFATLPEGFLSFPTSPAFGLADLVGFVLLYGLPHLVGSDVYSKLLSARDERAARAAALVSGGVKALFGLGVTVVALAARTRGAADGGRSVLPAMLEAAVPEPWRSLAALGLVAVLMSTANTVLLTASTVAARDVLPARFATARSARVAAALIALAGLALALAERESLLAPFRLGYSVYAAGLSLPVLAAFLPFAWRPAPVAVIAAMVLGGGGAVLLHALRDDPGDLVPVACGIALSAASLMAGIVARRWGARPLRTSS